MEDTLQDALKVQCSLLIPRRNAVERLCITSYEMTARVISSYLPAFQPVLRGIHWRKWFVDEASLSAEEIRQYCLTGEIMA